MMTFAILFTILGLCSIGIALFDKKNQIYLKIYFGFFGVLYAFVGIFLLIKLW